ncbi:MULTISPECIES: serine hydrolase [unclassified Streptomyces]|uniref:serine hydrolase n=1 Tax=unclassified Streptomyces TaxID=2593676 RepID=UPI002251C631|nr:MULTISPECIES: serine hydrolase [unclassified Streptomyces]MCX5338076.1 class A beta-lactamase-related serine hydrolase [Streptomyces sp. NBC_00140]MCX5364973.1 class A beta-lactamase-related serine hydrolase [Streptomyces sp. NBC_00124]
MESSRARRSRRSRPSRRRPLMYTALASVAIVGATAGGTVYVKAQAHSGAPSVSSAPSPVAAATSEEASVEPVTQPTVDHDKLLATAMESVTVPGDADVSVAVLDLDSGESATYGDAAFDTASIVKVDILAALLLQAQDEDRHLTAAEKSYATSMIENSDNASASSLWRIIGKAEGLDAANERLGLTSTEGGDGMLWGLTQTTAADQLALLRQVFGEDSELSSASREYVQGLMGQIAVDQHWGVSAAAEGSAWALKNGWLPRSTTGLWDINTIGRVMASDGSQYLVAALSNGNATKEKGISLVESAAQAAVSVFTG